MSPIFSTENGFAEDRILDCGNGNKFFYNDFQRARLNARYRAILEPMRQQLAGATVLDLASHDGRWSYAALRLGARYVVGVEWRQELIDFRTPAFDQLDPNSFRFIQGDVFEVLPALVSEGRQFDVVLNFGLFYHVMDHHLMLKLMRQLRPKAIVLDTVLIDAVEPRITLEMEPTESILNAIESKYNQAATIVGVPTTGGLNMMCASLGMGCDYIDWNATGLADDPSVRDYFSVGRSGRRRFSATLRPLEA